MSKSEVKIFFYSTFKPIILPVFPVSGNRVTKYVFTQAVNLEHIRDTNSSHGAIVLTIALDFIY